MQPIFNIHNIFLSALVSKNHALPTACALSFHRIGILTSRTTCHKLLLLRDMIMNYKHLGCIMDTPHYQDKHYSLCILAKAAQAVALNRRAACLTRRMDIEQKHMLTLLLKSWDCTRSPRNAARLSCAAITGVSTQPPLSGLLVKRPGPTFQLLSVKQQQSCLGESDCHFSENRPFSCCFSPLDIMSHTGNGS